MKFLFLACAAAIASVYYIGASQMGKDIEKINHEAQSILYALAGRASDGQFVEETLEEEEDETPYYIPPGQPKEEPYREVGYLQ